MTARAGPFQREKTLRVPNLAGAAAGRAWLRLGAGPGAASRASFACHRGWDANLRCFAGKSLVEGNFHVIAEVGPALTPGTPAAATCHAEDTFKDISKSRP